mgnify:CR=1 FL=1|eukprot:scaffold118539_cov31-Tisochrysis_lutea.AAC.5
MLVVSFESLSRRYSALLNLKRKDFAVRIRPLAHFTTRPPQVGARACIHADAPTRPLSTRLLMRACAELEPSVLDAVPVLLEGAIPLSEDDAAALRRCDAVLYGVGSPEMLANQAAGRRAKCSSFATTPL